MKFYRKISCLSLALIIWFLFSSVAVAEYSVTPHPFLNPEQHELLEEMLDTQLNYFLSSDVITKSGLPLGGYKEGDRGRFNYSNPTEWGYTFLCWIVAAERGRLSESEAVAMIEKALNTLTALQNNPAQNYQQLFYPYYYVANRNGQDLDMPYHDANLQIPSIDNGFLYTSLLITEGWAKSRGLTTLQDKANSISSKMHFRMFLKSDENQLYHTINAANNMFSSSKWDVYSDEGGIMDWIAYLSNSVTLNEYSLIINKMSRAPRSWNDINVTEAAFFNAMFTWSLRSLSGFPVATWETGIQNLYSKDSFVNDVKAHLVYGNLLGIDYPAFSDSMTQPGMTGRYTPPNITNTVPTVIPVHVVPHAFFVPLCIGPDLELTLLSKVMTKILELKNDTAGYYHYGFDGHKPFGFEVTASPYMNKTGYGGVEARYVFETLSASYTLLSTYQGLTINDGTRNLLHFASYLDGYSQKVTDVLTYLYPLRNAVHRVPEQYPTIQQAIDAAQIGDTIEVAAGTYHEGLVLKSGITLKGTSGSVLTPNDTSDDSIIDGDDTVRPLSCSGVANIIVEGFTFTNGHGSSGGNIHCSGNSVIIRNNLISNGKATDGGYGGGGVYLGGSKIQLIGNIIRDNWAWAEGGGVYIDAVDSVINTNTILGNVADYGGGICVAGVSPVITNNVIDGNWSDYAVGGGLYLSGASPQIINNTIVNNRAGQWRHGLGGAIYMSANSNPRIMNNVVANNSADNLTGGI